LCYDDREPLKNFITEQANEMDCIIKRGATTAASMLWIARQEKAIELLESIGSQETAADMHPETIAEPVPT
jgi:hypothetical protein